jgi:glutamine cyclotransferase
MSKITHLILLISILLITSCDKEYKFKFESHKKIGVNEVLSISLQEVNDQIFEKVNYSLDGKSIENPSNIDISKQRLGKHALTAIVFYGTKTKKLTNTIVFLADKKPIVYSYDIINIFPHDASAYTQGLEFHDGYLFESTGRKGQSSLRKVELRTGKVLQKTDVAPAYFAEGMTILGGKIYQLTWQSKIGFVYDLKEFKQTSTFNYGQSKEGWGLTNDGEKLIKTDGTEKIWFLDPSTLKEIGYIEAYTDEQRVKDLNELEYINGKIYANKWQSNILLIMNPENGAIEGIADLDGLEKEVRKSQRLDTNDDVLNGIAYDKVNDRLFVTGKHWGKLFEIKLKEK